MRGMRQASLGRRDGRGSQVKARASSVRIPVSRHSDTSAPRFGFFFKRLAVVSSFCAWSSVSARDGPPGLTLRRIDQRRHIPAHQVGPLSMPDRASQRVVRDRDRSAGTVLPEYGQRVPHIVRGRDPAAAHAPHVQGPG